LIGKNALLSVVHNKASNGNTYANIAGVMKLPVGMPESKPENETIYYSIDEHGLDLPKSITGNERLKWLQDKIGLSREIKKLNNPHSMSSDQKAKYNDAAQSMGGVTDDRDFSDGDPDIPF
jgi:hypothetical protein